MKKSNIINFAKIKETLELPDLLEIQKKSYEWFLQTRVEPSKRKNAGLESVFREVFPIEIKTNEKKIKIDYTGYEIGKYQYDEQECIDRDASFAVPIYLSIRLLTYDKNDKLEKIIQDKVYIGDLPYMTKRGTFIFNGAERTIVSQFHRSPGIFFEFDDKKDIIVGKIIPYHGTWLQFELDTKNLLSVRPDKKKKIPVTMFLRALGVSSNQEILSAFYKFKEMEISNKLENSISFEDVIYEETGEYICEAGAVLSLETIDQLQKNGLKKIKIIDVDDADFSKYVLNTLNVDTTSNDQEALKKLLPLIRGGNMKIPYEKAKEYVRDIYFNPRKYDLSETGRYKINRKFNQTKSQIEVNLTIEDIINLLKYMCALKEGRDGYHLDDIDHLGNRRVRCVGELLRNEFRKGMIRLEKSVQERLSSPSLNELEDLTPRTLINVKPVTAIIKEFFGSSQLSQFMDQTNPISEMTHKRRLSALGPGGLSRDRAGFEVRDVHHTHYGRVCPIETPEGPNIGLIVSLATYAKINDLGFIETPYLKVNNGVVTEQIIYMDALEEDNYYVAQANAEIDGKNKLVGPQVSVRYKDDFLMVEPTQVQYMDISPKQLVSATTALIPFLEHDDANRALMGSNMQRQAVPLMFPKSPVVGTGMEETIAKDSRVAVTAEHGGTVTEVCSNYIEINTGKVYTKDEINYITGEVHKAGEKIIDRYELLKFKRSNQCTTINQKPIVLPGDKVNAGEVIADGPAVESGELALGSNVTVAFMPWEGLNFEDAVLISDKLVKNDSYTSLHIEKFEVYARDTKLGKEQITRDIPNLSEQGLRNLDDDGIIKIGSKVKAGEILVGKVTPKNTMESTPEQKLLQSIFGEKARDVRDTSLKLKHGNEGIVIDVKVYSRENKDELPAGVEKLVKVYIATKRKIKEGDKVAGRHGNKGVISRVLPSEDMPYLADGSPVDIVLNPLGVPSRMNIGQILETHLGWAGDKLDIKFRTPVFDGADEEEIKKYLKKIDVPESGKVDLFDGRTGEKFQNPVTVGVIYMMKLNHLADEKIHARSIGPYSLVTQQPLGGKAQFGGQRLGEMEVWALEAYGAAYT
ncbi:DNA-directed RNA polymerase subunit beta, partial [Candidatus Dependentiae bacterium]|nr:DNA-directed RNA polymerase subunit beta [Candidatus Dependentiae bacterium]